MIDRSDTKTVMDSGLLGTPLHIEIDSTSLSNSGSQPIKMLFDMESQGRRQGVEAIFGSSNVNVTVNNSGNISHIKLKNPAGTVVDDPISLVLKGKKSGHCYILDPSTVSFIPNDFRVVSQTAKETVIEISDPRATTRVTIDSTGTILEAEGPMGIVMKPISKAEALARPSKYSPKVDLAYSNKIVPSGTLDDPAHASDILLGVSGSDLSHLPSDDVQTVTRSARGWTVDVHPPKLEKGLPITEAAEQKPQWVKPDLNMPSDSEQFRQLASSIVKDRTDSVKASMAVKRWVYDQMTPNAGIGVLRDAAEILKTKEGVCRDYAILTGTILRAAGIPTRLASGLVDWDGTFYYHAWDEIWDGKHWIGIDSTTPDEQISAAHVKLAEGDVANAFTFALLENVKIRIEKSRG
jgi:transglutaminase-like putative cysteine protease